MEKEDARNQTLEQLHERRKQVVRLHRQGSKIMQIVPMTGLSCLTVRAAIDLFEASGWSTFRPSQRGRPTDDGRVLSQIQEGTIQRMIAGKRPDQLKMDFHLCSRAAVGHLIDQEFGIKLQVRSIGKYFTRWGFTPQNPSSALTSKALQQCRPRLEGEYPPLSSAHKARALKFTRATRLHWSTPTCAAEALIKDAGKKVLLILDNLRVHRSKFVKAWVADRHEHIELFLPA